MHRFFMFIVLEIRQKCLESSLIQLNSKAECGLKNVNFGIFNLYPFFNAEANTLWFP